MRLREPDRTELVAVNRTRLRVWEWGDPAAPPVICVHGAFDHGRMWDGIAPDLAALGWRVLAPDLRGHGDSGRVSSGNIWNASALDLACLARLAGAPVRMVGHSFGGGQAAYVAGVWPELVRWLVNIDGLGPGPAAFEAGDLADLAEVATAGLAGFERTLGPPRVHRSLDDMAARRGAVNVRLPQAWLAHLVRHGSREVEGGYVWKADPTFAVRLPGSFSPHRLRAQHELVRCPTLVLTGVEPDTWSELTDEEVAERVAHFPDARHEAVAGAGHYVHIERLDAVLAAVAAFLDEVAHRTGGAR